MPNVAQKKIQPNSKNKPKQMPFLYKKSKRRDSAPRVCSSGYGKESRAWNSAGEQSVF
jgi:hypothetical protein